MQLTMVADQKIHQGRDDLVLAAPADRLPLAPLLISAFCFSLIMGSVYSVWANYMHSEAGFSMGATTALWATASTSELPLMMLAGWLSDRIGRLPMLSIGFGVWALVIIAYIFVPFLPWIILVQLTRGFAYSSITATSMAYAAEVRGRSQRGQVSGLYGSAGGMGAIVGAAIGGTLAQATSIKFMFGANAVVVILGAIYIAVIALRTRRQPAAAAA